MAYMVIAMHIASIQYNRLLYKYRLFLNCPYEYVMRSSELFGFLKLFIYAFKLVPNVILKK